MIRIGCSLLLFNVPRWFLLLISSNFCCALGCCQLLAFFFRGSFALPPHIVEHMSLGCSHAAETILLPIFPETNINTAIGPCTHTKPMSLVRLEPSFVECSIAVFEVAFALELICFELTDIERVLLIELEFADATPDAILPLTLVKVAVRPSVYSHTIRLVIEIVPEVHALVGVDVPS